MVQEPRRGVGRLLTTLHRRCASFDAFLSDPPFRVRYVGCFEDNIASRKIIERNGFGEIARQSIKTPFCPAPRIGVFFERAEDIGPLQLLALVLTGIKRLCTSLLARAMKNRSSPVQR